MRITAFRKLPKILIGLTALLLLLAFGVITWTWIRTEPPASYVLLGGYPNSNDPVKLYIADYKLSSVKYLFDLPRDYRIRLLSPNGQRIAFIPRSSTENLDIMETLSGKTLVSVANIGQTLTEEISYDEDVSWSPQSDQIVFLRNSPAKNGVDIFLLDIATSQAIPISTKGINRAPAWSPDGNQIAFTTLADCENIFAGGCDLSKSYWNLMIYNKKTAELKKLIEFHDSDLIKSGGIFAASPCKIQWSSSKRYLFFESECTMGLPTGKEIYAVDLERTTTRKVTNFANADKTYGINLKSLGLSVNDQIVVSYSLVQLWREIPLPLPKTGSLLIHPIYSPVYTLDSNFIGKSPIWSRNGYVINWGQPSATLGKLAGNKVGPLIFSTPLPVICSEPIWSPLQNKVTYLSSKDGKCETSDYLAVVISLDGEKEIYTRPFFQGNFFILGWLISE